MRSPFLGKLLAIGLAVVLMSIVLARIDWLVVERRQYQAEAVESVRQAHAGAQTLLGPVLRRECTEEWDVVVREGRSRLTETRQRHETLAQLPANLKVQGRSQADARYRGLFKVNAYRAELAVEARFDDLAALQPTRQETGSRLSCRPIVVWMALTDVRGLRTAVLESDGRALSLRPGTGDDRHPQGLHAELPADAAGPQALRLALDLAGIADLAVVPIATANEWTLASDWPHPSFGGRFLPGERKITDRGFDATWAVSALATSAPQGLLGGKGLQELDTLAVAFVDPVNPYSMSDRAIKYGLMFVLLSFGAVWLAEHLAQGRVRAVHPVQYALVGLAVALFFLLLLSLSEHLAFGIAYLIASGACAGLLGAYAANLLGRRRDGLAFGTGVGLMYALLYVLLKREQTALLIGSLGLFAVLAAVMLLTRRIDWHGLAPLTGSAPPPPPSA
jgi:inner membrane protein